MSGGRVADRDDGHSWALTAHVCRVCFGRVLRRSEERGERLYRCSNCGLQRAGADARAICACGIKLRTGADAGIRCVENSQPTPECPALIVAEQRVD